MSKLFFKLMFFRLLGWKIVGEYPYHLKKMIIIVAPHTSLWDVAVGVAVRQSLGFQSNFLVKKEFFQHAILSKILTWIGAVPVDRGNRKTDVVGEVVKLFKEREHFVIALAPEGTRSKVKRLKTGFHRIAKEANVPILPAGIDFRKKTVEFLEPFLPGENMDEDMTYLMDYFKGLAGKNPELGLHPLF